MAVGLVRAKAATSAARARLASSLAMVLASLASVSAGPAPTPGKPASPPARKNVKLPGLVIDLQERCVDIEATICLDEGMLELVACTKGTKEHESIVAVEARAMHIHAALLLLGANPGNPAMRKALDEDGQETRWIDVPPRGDPVDVFLVFKNREGKTVERPVSAFVTRQGHRQVGQRGAEEGVKFPHTFIFAGSHIHGDGPGPRQYLADVSGNVISVSTFGDELLCLPGLHSQDNGALMWQLDATNMPDVGTAVILRLRPKARRAPKARMNTDGMEREAK